LVLKGCLTFISNKVFWIFLYLVFPSFLWSQDESAYQINSCQDHYILGGGFILAATGFYLRSQIKMPDLSRLDKNRILFLDRFAVNCTDEGKEKISDITLILSSSLPVIPALNSGSSKSFGRDILIYSESTLLTFGITFLSKAIFKRPRPYAYRYDLPPEKRLKSDTVESFFSGHTSMAFNGAIVAGLLYQDHFTKGRSWMWTAGLSTAVLTGILRVTSGNHFPTDVLVGAVMGSLCGYLVLEMHR
jgi:membrane-associated phospholipid phosphatase